MNVQQLVSHLIEARTWLGMEEPRKAIRLIRDIDKQAPPILKKRYAHKINEVVELIQEELA